MRSILEVVRNQNIHGSILDFCRDRNIKSFKGLVAFDDIDRLHKQKKGNFGRLGAPIGTLSSDASGNFNQEYKLGSISIADSKPAIATTKYKVRFKLSGVHCFGTDDPSGTDETYLIASVISVDPARDGQDNLVLTKKIGPVNTEAGGTFGQSTTLADAVVPTGCGLKVHLALFDEEQGNPENVRSDIEKFLVDSAKEGAAAISSALTNGTVNSSGTIGDVLNSKIGKFLTFNLSSAIANIFADDFLGETVYTLDAGLIPELFHNPGKFDRVEIFNTGGQVHFNLPFPAEDFLFHGNDSSYRVYLRVEVSRITETL